MLRLDRAIRAESNRRDSDSGQVMIAVVGLLAVTVVITAVVATATVRAAGFTTMTRAGVEAQAAAESGVQAAIVALNNGECVSDVPLTRSYGEVDPNVTGTDASAPYFSARISSRAGSSSSWVESCPTADTTEIRITSTGFALNGGLSDSNSGRDDAAVEAIYEWDVTEVEPADPIPASGASLYNYGSAGGTHSGSNFRLVGDGSGAEPAVQFRFGNYTCNSQSRVSGSVTVAEGSLLLDNPACIVEGDVHAGRGVRVNAGARVEGSVYAAGRYGSTNYSFTSGNAASRVDGNVFANGPIEARGPIGGNVLAGPTTGNSLFFSGGIVGGNFTTAGGIRTDGGICSNCSDSTRAATALKNRNIVGGTVSFEQGGIAVPTIPTVPDWVDFAYDPTDWIDSNGQPFTEVVLPSNACNWTWEAAPGMDELRAAIASSTPTIINALACSGGISWYFGLNPRLNSDLVIVANKFAVGGNNQFSSATGEVKRLWMITPDRNPSDRVPTCTSPAGNSVFNSGTRVTSTVAAMFYTPCDLDNNSAVWRGQMYARNAFVKGGLELTYTPIGLPGVNLSTGTTGGSSGGSSGGGGTPGDQTVGGLISFRDIPVPTS